MKISEDKDEITFTRAELDVYIREIITDEVKTSKRFKEAIKDLLFDIAALSVGRSVLDKLKLILGVGTLGFFFWLSQNGFVEWLKAKGIL